MSCTETDAEKIERLELELSIARDALEDAYEVINTWDFEARHPEERYSSDDADESVRRVTLRRLSEAVGRALPRLMFEQAEGQKFYGLRYRELYEENKQLRA